jgi:pimeloyl-ACP methyl ester carboxylesterase
MRASRYGMRKPSPTYHGLTSAKELSFKQGGHHPGGYFLGNGEPRFMPASDTADLVFVLPGIMGSTLARDGKLIWAPSAGSVLNAIRTFGANIRALELKEDIGDGEPNDGVEPVALMPDLHVLPGIWTANIGYQKLLDTLRRRLRPVAPRSGNPTRISNIVPIAYDWRLSNRYNGERLKTIVKEALDRWRAQGPPYKDAKVIFICHSMGGLVARWYIEKAGGAEITRKLITLGTPYRGAVSALDQLVNGVHKGIGPIRFDFSKMARSLPSLYQLLPEYACIESTGQLLKTTEIAVPGLKPQLVENAMQFHDELNSAALLNKAHAYDLIPIRGFRQPTSTTARISDEAIEVIDTIAGNDERGDGTVPWLSALPKSERTNSPVSHNFADKHGALQSNHAIIDQIESALTGSQINHRLSVRTIGVRTDAIVLARETVAVEADECGVALGARAFDEQDRLMAVATLQPSANRQRGTIGPLKPGAYRVVVGAADPRSLSVAPVTSTVLVWDTGIL